MHCCQPPDQLRAPSWASVTIFLLMFCAHSFLQRMSTVLRLSARLAPSARIQNGAALCSVHLASQPAPSPLQDPLAQQREVIWLCCQHGCAHLHACVYSLGGLFFTVAIAAGVNRYRPQEIGIAKKWEFFSLLRKLLS
jgi:hypothetical protein